MILEPQYDSSKLLIEAINILLQTINQLPIEEEEDLSNIVEAKIALSVLIETKKEVLSDQWDINTDVDYILPVDLNGYINIPANILDLYDDDGKYKIVDWRLYDKENHTAKFEEPKLVTIIWDVDFNMLTHPIRNYITIRAARKFQARQVMDTSVYAYTKEDEENAYKIARRSEARTGKYNMLTGNFGTSVGVR